MLSQLLQLEKIGSSTYLAKHSQSNFRNTLFGGQVLAQALMAAGQSTPRPIHSLHAYFLRAGVFDAPLTYQVAPLRDGRSVSTREVKAIQNGELIFTMLCSFHDIEPGYSHQSEHIGAVPTAEAIKSKLTAAQLRSIDKVAETLGTSPIECVPCDFDLMTAAADQPARARIWMKSLDTPSENDLYNACSLAFASDIGLLATTLLPHNTTLFSGTVIPASMDHSIWFHRPVRFADWHLYQTSSPWTGNARGLSHGAYYDSEGTLVATTSQEGLIRPTGR